MPYLNLILIFSVFFVVIKINKEHRLKLEAENLVLLEKLKNTHFIPREEIATAIFDGEEVLWILKKDKEGNDIKMRADGKPAHTIDDDYEYSYIRDATKYPI